MRIFYEDGQACLFDPDGYAGKMCQAALAAGHPRGQTSGSYWRRSSELKAIPVQSLDLTPGSGNLLGEFYWELISPWRGGSSMLNTGPAPRSGEGACSLSRILQDEVPPKYYLARTACLGILRRAGERGKELPEQLKTALMLQSGLIPACTHTAAERNINRFDQSSEAQNDPSAPIAFAANQRDEVRDLHDVAGALGAQPGMKQQTFLAENCLNPWDTQQQRIFTPESTAPALAGADGGGGRNPAGLLFAAGFCAGAAPTAGSIGYAEELSPTLKAASSGTNMVPSILCLNDQGGKMMGVTEDVTGTLRAQEHGHQPLVLNAENSGQIDLYENHGVDSRYRGPLPVAPTLSARAGTGGNNLPLVRQADQQTVFSRQRVDVFKPDEVASTQSARQHKDATDLILQEPYQETVGALTSSDFKGPNSQYVGQDKCVVEGPHLIRRLTPLECERLQGYPDGFTDIPGAADSARYRALGNSIAISCVEYIMQGLALAAGA